MRAIGNYGRFCNQAYQIAGILGIARRNNLEPVFPLWENRDHRDRFGSAEEIKVYEHFVNQLPALPEGITFIERPVAWGYRDMKLPAGNWNLSGHFQSERYFEHCLDEAKWYFRMKDEPPQNDYVAIHVRRGDYDDHYHPRIPEGYYRAAMAEFPGRKFLVFSDDIQACKEMFGSEVEYSEGRDYLEDFKLLKRCHSFIIANSTYSSMAAVLGDAKDKKVIAPRPWFGSGYTEITGEDIYGSDWTIIDYEARS